MHPCRFYLLAGRDSVREELKREGAAPPHLAGQTAAATISMVLRNPSSVPMGPSLN